MTDALKIEHFYAGDIYSKAAHIPAGHILVQHKHKYDHLSVLASGTVIVEVDGVRAEHTGPTCLNIKAGAHHGVRALTDAVWYCIHSVTDAEKEDADELLILPYQQEDMTRIAEGLLHV